MKLTTPLVALLPSLAILAACGGGGGTTPNPSPPPPPAPPQALADRFAIDGTTDFSVFPSVNQQTVDFVDALGAGVAVKSTTVQWGIMNDDKDVYIAVTWTDDTYDHNFTLTDGPVDFDGIQLLIDDDASGTIDAADDLKTVIAASVSSHYVDQHFDGQDITDQVGDGLGRLAYDAASASYTAELLLPLSADAAGEDGNLINSTPYNIRLYDHVQLASTSGAVTTVFPSSSDSSGWLSLGIVATVAHARRTLPNNLGGLFAFISEHDVDVNGEIYTFDPASGAVTRVTTLPAIFKDGVSLSHDRTRVAFYGGPSLGNFSAYEIYSVNVDGSNLRQLTNNAILDGHPAWSPDDSRLVYASFRDIEGESLVTMTAEGTEIADLTPLGFHDNDPDYLADGRIVFKTDRFNAVPQLQIAVMNEDGSNVVQVTSQTGVSDHDPVAQDGFTVFERFTKGTEYSTDPEALFVGWDIVEASLSGGETTLLSDGWINWLPLYSPGGQYVAFQKSTGAYTDVRLMTRQGDPIGRLIPDITAIRYLDWK